MEEINALQLEEPGQAPDRSTNRKDIPLSLEMVAALAVSLYFLYCSLEHPFQPDLFYMIKSGGEFWRTKGVIEQYPFSWVPPECTVTWINYQWLAHLILWLLYSLWGLYAVAVFKSLLYGAGYLLMLRHASAKSGYLAAILSIFPAILLGKVYFLERPMAFTSLFFSLLAYMLFTIERTSLRFYHWIAFPAIFTVWVNMHGGFLPGLVFVLIAFAFLSVRDFIRLKGSAGRLITAASLSAVWLMCLLSTLFLTPYGTMIFQSAVDFIFLRPVFINVAGDMISPLKEPAAFIPFLAISLVTTLFVVFSLIKGSHRFTAMELFVYFFWLLFALRAQRNVQIYSAAAVPAMALIIHRGLEFISLGLSKRSLATRLRPAGEVLKLTAFIALLALCFCLVFTTDFSGKSYERRIMPSRLKDFLLENRLPSKIYCYDVIGDYLMFYLYPRYKVSLDSSWNMCYSDRYFIEISRSYGNRDEFFAFINKYGLDTIILHKKPSFLDGVPGWLLIYEGEGCRVFLRESPENREIVERFEKDLLVYPDTYEVSSFLFERHATMGDLRTARKYLLKLIEANPEEKVLRENLQAIDRELEKSGGKQPGKAGD
jgi:hypothetical protein